MTVRRSKTSLTPARTAAGSNNWTCPVFLPYPVFLPTDGQEQDCESFYYVAQDANYNVLGVVDATGTLVERYEYSPYGKRSVFLRSGGAGGNDTDCSAPTSISQRAALTGGGLTTSNGGQPWGLCDLGHQGLQHEEELSNGQIIQNRYRIILTRFGRFGQTDPLGYPDGMNRYQYSRSNPMQYIDQHGLWGSNVHKDKTKEWAISEQYPDNAALAIGQADEDVDSFFKGRIGPIPYKGNQGYHFDENQGRSIDIRLKYSEEHFHKAVQSCNWALNENDDPALAAKELGTSLHPLQDWVAHGDYGRHAGVDGKIWAHHNAWGPYASGYGDPSGYPDEIGLDAIGGPDGRPAGRALYYGPRATLWGVVSPFLVIQNREYAYYQSGSLRINLTERLTRERMQKFRGIIKYIGGCNCKAYFNVQ